jgi:hypothetical protein
MWNSTKNGPLEIAAHEYAKTTKAYDKLHANAPHLKTFSTFLTLSWLVHWLSDVTDLKPWSKQPDTGNCEMFLPLCCSSNTFNYQKIAVNLRISFLITNFRTTDSALVAYTLFGILCLWPSSIVRYCTNRETQRFGNCMCFSLQVRKGRNICSVGSLRQSFLLWWTPDDGHSIARTLYNTPCSESKPPTL